MFVCPKGGEIKTLAYSYDEAGALKWASDDNVFTGYNGARQGIPGSYTPDVYGRITGVANSLDGRTFSAGYEYNISDRIVGITNPTGGEVFYDYNLLGEITDVQGYLGSAPEYDAGGFITTITAANGVHLILDYDDEGKMTERSFESTTNDALKGYLFSYDEAGNITSLNENFYSYDKRNQLTFAVLNGSFGVDPEETNQEAMAIEQDDVFGIDTLEEIAEDTIIALDYAAGSIGVDLKSSYEVAQVYLRPGMVSRVTVEQLKVFVSDSNGAGSDAWSEVAEFEVREHEDGGFDIILSSPVVARFVKVKTDYNERDIDFEPIDFAEFKASAKDIIKIYYYLTQRVEDYEYDNAGNRTSKTISYNGNITEQNRDYLYYPGTNRLLTDGRYAFQYDANGNMRAKGTMIIHEGLETQISGITAWDNYTSSIAGESGSIVFADSGEITRYEYDLLNRLVSVTKNVETVVEYTYNAESLRVKKEKVGEAEYFFFDLAGNLLYEEHIDETYTSYTYIRNTRFARENGNVDGSITPVRYYYHTDHLGSTVMVTDESGEVVWDGEYTPFGGLNDPLNIGDGVVQFTGKDMDFDTGLYYYNARWYDPGLGRFITEDPIKDGLNWYVYVASNPLRFVDPTGLNIQESETLDGEDPVTPREREQRDKIDESVGKIKELEDLDQMSFRNRISLFFEREALKTRLGRLAENGSESSKEWIRANMEIEIITGFYGDRETDYYDGKVNLNFQGVTLESMRVQTWATEIEDPEDFSLPYSEEYEATLNNTKATLYESIFNITGTGKNGKKVLESYFFYIHPDTVTKKANRKFGTKYTPPISRGCIIAGLDDFNRLVDAVRSFGFADGDSMRMSIDYLHNQHSTYYPKQ